MGGGHGGFRGGRRSAGESSRSTGGASSLKDERKGGFFTLLAETLPFIRPHRWLLLSGFVLMAINRLAGLVLPASMKFLVDDVLGKRQTQLLLPFSRDGTNADRVLSSIETISLEGKFEQENLGRSPHATANCALVATIGMK